SIDPETLFPMRILFYPTQRSPLYYIAGPSTPITIDYRDVMFAVPKEDLFSFEPSEETRVFSEEETRDKDLADTLPFTLDLERISQRGYKLHSDRITLTANEGRQRAYAFLSFEKAGSNSKRTSGLSLRVGNYLSPDMNRRRALLADNGEEVDLASTTGRIIDREALLKDEIPESVRRSLLEIGWQENQVYWFLLGEGIDREELIGIASAMTSSDDEADQPEE
ncbi:hypothetical protein J7K60_05865, partial [Candidatus Bipolaricaulota bacterium]|nr:hypothetical protein [Candidatus Bipolaricaulota bacterium]